jgi:DNA helicase-2/ATP-dependent DNA helicase PcrA
MAPKPFVQWIELPTDKNIQFETQIEACKQVSRNAKNSENVLAVHHWEAQCNRLVNRMAPAFGNIETIECDDLMKSADAIHGASGLKRMNALVDFAAKCLTGVRSELGTVLKALSAGRRSKKPPYKHQRQLNLLAEVIDSDSLKPVLPVLQAIRLIPGTKIWRRELYFAMCQSLREYAMGKHESLKDAAWTVRNRTRRVGRRIGFRTIGRTLLVKGLEFDHCLLLDADALDSKDLYVALTRGSRSLTVLSRGPVLKTQKDSVKD